MAYTQLSVTATPGGIHTFSAKTKGGGFFTALSVAALPGKPHVFLPKAGTHIGLFTALSVIALPGVIRSFAAKTAVVPIPSPIVYAGGGGGVGYVDRVYRDYEWERKAKRREEILRDDQEILEMISMITPFLN